MKRILILMLLLSLIGCNRPPKIIETNENALIHISEEDHVQFSIHNDGNIHTLATEEILELIDILNETSYTGEETEGKLISELSYVRLKVNGDEHTFFGNYYISRQYDTDLFKQLNNSELYNFFANKINLALNEKDQELLKNKKVPDKNNDPGTLKVVNAFIQYHNQYDFTELPFYHMFGIDIPQHKVIDSIDKLLNVSFSNESIRATEYLNEKYYIEYDYDYYHPSLEGEYCYIKSYINQKYFLEQVETHTRESELAELLSKVLSTWIDVEYSNYGITSGITFADNKNEEIYNIQHGPRLPEPVYFKIATFEGYPVSTREDLVNYFRQYFVEEKAQEYTAEMFDYEQANFIEKEDGVYMGINQDPSGLGGDWPTMQDTFYTFETEDAVYAYLLSELDDYESDDPYASYYSYKFLKTPYGLRY